MHTRSRSWVHRMKLEVMSLRHTRSRIAAVTTFVISPSLDLTVGFWQNVYKGDYGRVAVGAQYEYIKREVFEGVGGAPSTDNNIVLTSLRYYPF